jgi:hypothetical protein
MYLDGGFAQDIRDAFEPPRRRYDSGSLLPMPKLSVREGGPEGDYDAEKYGYWYVTGTQPETEVYGMILLLVGDEYEWEVHRRIAPEKNTTSTYVARIKHGRVPTYDHAIAALRDAWPTGAELAADPDVSRTDVPWASIRDLGEEEEAV